MMTKGLTMETTTRLNTAPSEEPVTLLEVKDYLRVDGTGDDTVITRLIVAARLRLEAYADVKFISQKWDVLLDRFPSTYRDDIWWDGSKDLPVSILSQPATQLILPIGPLLSVESFNTFADDDVAVPFDPSQFTFGNKGNRAVISLKLGGTWPTTILKGQNGIKITAVVGVAASAAACPGDIKQALLALIGMMFEHRGDELPEIPVEAQMLLNPYTRYKLGQ